MSNGRVNLRQKIFTIAQEVCDKKRIPSATYRLQFHQGFTFQDAAELVAYLHDLGITDYYASPFLKARPGSQHGYDICDPTQLNPEVGTNEDFDRMVAALREQGMGLILDLVPNHMGIAHESNHWWMDVLENGPSSSYASYFDIDWDPIKAELKNKVLLPILEDQYGKVLESRKLLLSYDGGAFHLNYYQHRLPLAPRTYGKILNQVTKQFVAAIGDEDEQFHEFQSILTAISYLPPRTQLEPDKVAERNREKEVIKRRIATLYSDCNHFRETLDIVIDRFNGEVGNPATFDLLDDLIEGQAYRLTFWRVATDEINYRRFFDINELAAIRVETPEVFKATHDFVEHLLADGKVTGLRIDHPDGLWDPAQYFRRIQHRYLERRIQAKLPNADNVKIEKNLRDWFDTELLSDTDRLPPLPVYIVSEKILSEVEPLPENWALDGTTGYDFLNEVNGLYVQSKNQRVFDRIYTLFIGRSVDYEELVKTTKKLIMHVSLSSEINLLAYELDRVSEKNRRHRDFTLNSIAFALREVIASLPVYRTYLTGPDTVSDRDRSFINEAVAAAKKASPRTARAVFNFIHNVLLLENTDDFSEEDRPRLTKFVMSYQQLTGPVMAKSVEDTVFYLYSRLLSLNEVGGHPARFGYSLRRFHEQNIRRQTRWPHTLLTASTHDTKRSEDVRARINVLSEIPDEWRGALARWSRFNDRHKCVVDGESAPDRNEEYLLYQTLLGTWPSEGIGSDWLTSPGMAEFRERIVGYMQKATREAKAHTSWINPNDAYDEAVKNFVSRILTCEHSADFLEDFQHLQRRVSFYGQFNSLSQTLLKLTSPGVPDTYQGTELYNFRLVDPDNRQPVDYNRRRWLLDELRGMIKQVDSNLISITRLLLSNQLDDRLKLYTVYKTLNFRRQHFELFNHGSYIPLNVWSEKKEHVCAFARTYKKKQIIVVVPRLIVSLTEKLERPPIGTKVWGDSWLEITREQNKHQYRNLFTGEMLQTEQRDKKTGFLVAKLLNEFPVALVEKM